MSDSICTTCTRASVCADRSYSMAKCDRYDPIFNAAKAAVNTYGREAQRLVLFGEIGELMTAIADHQRGRDTMEHVAEEIADVLVCIDELIYALDCKDAVERWRDYKLRRLATRIALEEGDEK